jgi:putative transposase
MAHSNLTRWLQNHLHHRPSRGIVDECSSARWFTGWAHPLGPADTPSPVAAPKTWLARVGWRRHGPIYFDEGPAR